MTERKALKGRYELERLPLARGGMGEVWVGHDVELDREVAVKFLRVQEEVDRDELTRRFVRESRITARLQHPGVPAVFDVGTDEGRPYLVMQRVRGMSVSDLLAVHHQLSIGWSAAIAAQVCSVLVEAHQASLVHRDLKPANLMLEPDGTVKVLDFGLAAALGVTDTSTITRSGQGIGTPAYMAPEQVLAAMSGPRTDLYSLGCSLYEMLTGRHVFTGPTSYAVMNKQVDQLPTAAREHRPEIPFALNTVLNGLLEKKPENRPDSAQVVYEQLLPFVRDVGSIPSLLNPPTDLSPVRMYAAVLNKAFDDDSASAGALTAAPNTAAPDIISGDLDEARAAASELATQARFKEAAQLLGAMLDPDVVDLLDPEVVNARLEWANILFEGGDYHAAAPAYQALIADLAARSGPDSELVFRCRAQYAECQAMLGNMTVAIETAQRLLADEQRVYHPTDPRPFELRRKVGQWQLAAGQRDEAEQTLRTLLDDLLRKYSETHPAVAKVRDLLASLTIR
ncbi:protein kinase domain-containing protein [Amycolatopsis sp. lyj-23]|uniref:protein kinase domain-containing protein n=1 Tax=Amycolatopsis sp. lyj-23 TaxID=2789283 RepID=UPI00397BA690